MANTFVDIKSWPLLFSLITKRQLDNVNFNVVGRSYYAGDILLPYTQKKLSEVTQEDLEIHAENLTLILDKVCVVRTDEAGNIERTVINMSQPGVIFRWEH